jgi:hypothetical protein
MTITEYTHNLEKFQKNLSRAIFKKVAEYASADLRGQIENRVEQTQTNANGGKFSRYSSSPMLTSGNTVKSKRVWQKMASTKDARKNLSWVTLKKGGKNVHLFELPGGYAELRRLEGFSNPNKSFEFTGVMWDQFNVISKQSSQNGFLIRMGGQTKYSQDLINIHSEKESIAIIGMTQKEQELLHKNVDIWIEQFANECKVA